MNYKVNLNQNDNGVEEDSELECETFSSSTRSERSSQEAKSYVRVLLKLQLPCDV